MSKDRRVSNWKDRHLRMSSSTLPSGVKEDAPRPPKPEDPGVRDPYPTADPKEGGYHEAPELNPLREVRDYTPREVLTWWGLRTQGSNFTNAGIPSTGGAVGAEEEGQIAEYVMGMEGFWEAEPVLRHIYVEFKDSEIEDDLKGSTYDPRRPGERLLFAVGRHVGLGRSGWTRYQFSRQEEIGPDVHKRFLVELGTALNADPFVFIHALPEPDKGAVTEGEREQLERLEKGLPAIPSKKENAA